MVLVLVYILSLSKTNHVIGFVEGFGFTYFKLKLESFVIFKSTYSNSIINTNWVFYDGVENNRV